MQFSSTELEIRLRQHCQCVKVVARPLNGAHLLVLPASTGEVTIAVRVYYGDNLPPHSSELSENDNDDIDGLAKFQKSFALAVVFVVLTPSEQKDQLLHRPSFVRRAQHLLTTVSTFTTKNNKNKPTTTRLWLVSSTDQAVQALIGMANALLPAKRQLQRAWYEHQQQQAYVPVKSNTKNNAAATRDPSILRVAAQHAQQALAQWAQRNGVPSRDVQLLWQAYGSLETLVRQVELGLPGLSSSLSPHTPRLLYTFFYGTDPAEWQAVRAAAAGGSGGGGVDCGYGSSGNKNSSEYYSHGGLVPPQYRMGQAYPRDHYPGHDNQRGNYERGPIGYYSHDDGQPETQYYRDDASEYRSRAGVSVYEGMTGGYRAESSRYLPNNGFSRTEPERTTAMPAPPARRPPASYGTSENSGYHPSMGYCRF